MNGVSGNQCGLGILIEHACTHNLTLVGWTVGRAGSQDKVRYPSSGRDRALGRLDDIYNEEDANFLLYIVARMCKKESNLF